MSDVKLSLSSILLWKLERTDDGEYYDAFRSAIVAARTFDEAVRVHPAPHFPAWDPDNAAIIRQWAADDRWAPNPKFVNAKPIGLADESIEAGTVILADFRDG